ncbi:hypothetical protein TrVE_jg6084 [Triparma verrucosa]|uniref:Pseudouridine synthase RsuA/RluA-like domain-containing protein n=1 Tax=Triparma verrucosa TaxID=1606542 RepID=A0A9W7C0C0_9STRA|nr:hypothetical protein TrVE_jg6084 [Triparma verrucosa]
MNVLDLLRSQREVVDETLFSVHRLDDPTSGLLCVAKDSDAAGKLQRGFQNRARDKEGEGDKAIKKFYVAIVSRKLKKKMGIVKGDLVKGRRGSWKLEEKGGEGGYDNFSQTNFVDLGPTGGEGREGQRVVLMHPLTGRTHQLRVTMRALGAGIVGDSRYGGVCGEGEEVERLYLHACGLRLDLKSMELGDENIQLLVKPDNFRLTDDTWTSLEEHVFGVTTSASSKFFRGGEFDQGVPVHRQTV